MKFIKSLLLLLLLLFLSSNAYSQNYDLVDALQNERPTQGSKTALITYDMSQFANPVNNTNDAFRELQNLGFNVMVNTANEIQSRYPNATIIYNTPSRGEIITFKGIKCGVQKLSLNRYYLYFNYDIIYIK